MSFDKQQLNQKTRQAKGQVFVTPANLLCSPERVCQVLCLCHVAKTCLCHSSDPRIPHFATHRTWLMRPTAPGQVSEYQSEPQLPGPEAPPARKLTAAAKTQIDQRLWRYPQIKGASAGKGVRGVWGGEEEEGQGADMAIFVPWNRYGIKGSGTLCHYPGTRTEERPPATENKNILQIYFYYAKIIAHRPMAVAHKYGKWKINGNSIVICTYTVESLHY